MPVKSPSHTQLATNVRQRLSKSANVRWRAVRCADDPLLVDDAAAAEVAAAVLQRHLPRPAVRHRLDATHDAHAHAGRDGRAPALRHARRHRHPAVAAAAGRHHHRRLRPCSNTSTTNNANRFMPAPILSVFPALSVHSELKSVHPGFPVAFIF